MSASHISGNATSKDAMNAIAVFSARGRISIVTFIPFPVVIVIDATVVIAARFASNKDRPQLVARHIQVFFAFSSTLSSITLSLQSQHRTCFLPDLLALVRHSYYIRRPQYGMCGTAGAAKYLIFNTRILRRS